MWEWFGECEVKNVPVSHYDDTPWSAHMMRQSFTMRWPANEEMNKEMRANRGCDSADDDLVVASHDLVLDEMQGRWCSIVFDLMMVCCFRWWWWCFVSDDFERMRCRWMVMALVASHICRNNEKPSKRAQTATALHDVGNCWNDSC